MTDETPPALRPPDWSEQAILDAYKESIKTALDAANTGAQTILTAGFSIATAYGAVIALVAPKDEPSPLQVVLPFVGFGAAVFCAMVARSLGVAVRETTKLSDLKGALKGAVTAKQWFTWVSLLFIVLALIGAGWVITDVYAPEEDPEGATVSTILLTPKGLAAVSEACGSTVSEVVKGKVSTDSSADGFLEIELEAKSCGDDVRTLLIPAHYARAVLSAADD